LAKDQWLGLETNGAIKVECSKDSTQEEMDKQQTSGTQWEKDLWAAMKPVVDAADADRSAATDAEVKAEWEALFSPGGNANEVLSASA
jgi:hypothetical protein